MKKDIIIIGAGGHAKVIAGMLLHQQDYCIVGYTDASVAKVGNKIIGYMVLGNDNVIQQYSPTTILLANGIGFVPSRSSRQTVYQHFQLLGYQFPALRHPAAVVADDVQLAPGSQVMAGAILQPGVRIGENSIINTKASIDHDCSIGADTHIAPGVTMGGDVSVGCGTFIGMGAVILPGVHIGNHCVIGAGSVVLKDVMDNDQVLGVPARSYVDV